MIFWLWLLLAYAADPEGDSDTGAVDPSPPDTDISPEGAPDAAAPDAGGAEDGVPEEPAGAPEEEPPSEEEGAKPAEEGKKPGTKPGAKPPRRELEDAPRPVTDPRFDRAREQGEDIVQDIIDELSEPIDDEEPELVVTEKQVDPAADPAANRATVDGERLRTSPEATVLESLSRDVPGLHSTTRGVGFHGVGPGSSGGITMRGLGGSPNTQVLTVIDGAPEYQGVFGHPLPDLLLPELVEEISVTPGGDSVRYGGSAMAAVIRVDSRWRETDGLTLNMDTRLGAFDTFEWRPSLLARQGSWDIAAAVNARTSEGQREGAGGHLVATQLAARRRFVNGGKVQVRTRFSTLSGGDPGPINRPSPEATFEQRRAGMTVNATSRKLGMVEARGVFWLSGGRQLFATGDHVADGMMGGFGEVDWRPSRALRLTIGSWSDLTFGEWSNRITGETSEIVPSGQSALYGQVTATPYDWLIFMGGVRGVATSDGKFFMPYKVGVYGDLWSGASLRLRHASNYRQPSIAERYLPLPVANPDLEAERSSTTELMLQQQAGGGELRASLWRTRGREIIRTYGAFPDVEIGNIGIIDVRGFELQGTGRPAPWLDLNAGISLQDAGTYTRQNPGRMVNGSVRFHNTWNAVSVTGRYLGELYADNGSRDEMPDVLVVDAQYRRRLDGLPAEVYLLGRNLTNQPNATLQGYPIPGAHLMVGFTWTGERDGPVWDGDLELPSIRLGGRDR